MTVGRSTSPTHVKGQQAEEWALLFLTQQGYALVQQNYSCKMGEIDLILRKNKLLIFVEVRTRNTNAYGGAAASVTYSKQRKISRTAALFLQTHPRYGNDDCRFDVIAFEQRYGVDQDPTAVDWIQGAFDAV